MQSNPIYKKLLKAAEKYTVGQAEALTNKVIIEVVKDAANCTGTFINNMKTLLVKNLQAKQDAVDDERIKFVLDVNFPEWKETRLGKSIDSSVSLGIVNNGD
tara:strand:+ start:262 stop:567 length:306 start_codon:yes stop_codon:yes gene_type:complete